MDEACEACGAKHPDRWDLECSTCGTLVSYCAACTLQRTAEGIAACHAERCGGRVTLAGPGIRVTIGATAAAAR